MQGVDLLAHGVREQDGRVRLAGGGLGGLVVPPRLLYGADVERLPGRECARVGQDGGERHAYGRLEAEGHQLGQRRDHRTGLLQQRRPAETSIEQPDVVDLLLHLPDEHHVHPPRGRDPMSQVIRRPRCRCRRCVEEAEFFVRAAVGEAVELLPLVGRRDAPVLVAGDRGLEALVASERDADLRGGSSQRRDELRHLPPGFGTRPPKGRHLGRVLVFPCHGLSIAHAGRFTLMVNKGVLTDAGLRPPLVSR